MEIDDRIVGIMALRCILIFILAMAILFRGEPDIIDAIVHRLMLTMP